MADASLVAMFDEVRGMTLRVLTGVDDAAARWHPPGLANSILWHAGHNYVVLEWIATQSLGCQPVAPPGWFDLFSWDSNPSRTPAASYPVFSAVIEQLQAQHARLSELFHSLSEADLARPSVEWPERTVRQMILHAFQDEASHKGEIWLLRKLQGKV